MLALDAVLYLSDAVQAARQRPNRRNPLVLLEGEAEHVSRPERGFVRETHRARSVRTNIVPTRYRRKRPSPSARVRDLERCPRPRRAFHLAPHRRRCVTPTYQMNRLPILRN